MRRPQVVALIAISLLLALILGGVAWRLWQRRDSPPARPAPTAPPAGAPHEHDAEPRSPPPPPAPPAPGRDEPDQTIRVHPVMVQRMSVRTAPVRRVDLVRPIRTIGEIIVAEDLLAVINLRFSGWIEKLYVEETGARVKKGQPLFRIYSPELVSAQAEYLMAVRTAGRKSPLARSARARLELWDLSDATIGRILRRGRVQRTLLIRAPNSGYVLHKDVVEGARVQPGQDLFRIGKLDRIWVQAQVYEFDAPWVQVGQPATMELAFQAGRPYRGEVEFIHPTLNEQTRTLTVRLQFANPGLQLKPGMFATVRIAAQRKEDVLAVPTSAILHSGERQIVFAVRGFGIYEPREIVTGLIGGDFLTEVLEGLQEGEEVVTSGQFLLDSESQLQEAMQKMTTDRLQQPDGEPSGKPPPAARPPAGPQHVH